MWWKFALSKMSPFLGWNKKAKNSPVMGWGGLSLKKMSNRCQMSRSQTHGLWRRFTRKKNDIMRFTYFDINFDVNNEGHQKCSKTLSMHILTVFWSPSCVTSKLMSICVNLLHSPCVWLFDIFLTTWHLFDNLTYYLNYLSLSHASQGVGQGVHVTCTHHMYVA